MTCSRLDFADVAFDGNLADGRKRIGIERKKVEELVVAMTDDRFVGYQLPGLLKSYADRYLLVEGTYYPDWRTGLLMVNGREGGYGLRRFMYDDFEHFVMSLRRKAGLVVVTTKNEKDSAWWLRSCYTWYQKRWTDHKSVYAVEEVRPDSAILTDQTLCRIIAAQLPQIGWTRSYPVAKHFGSTYNMAVARVADWLEVPGIGKGIARLVTRAIRSKD